MARYSMNRRDKKLAGVTSTFGEIFNIDPTLLRIGLVLTAIAISWKLAVVLYVGTGLYLHFAKKNALRRTEDRGGEQFDRPRRTSIHELRTQLDANDRRMMAIDHHLNRQNDELAREIEALRGEK